MLTSPKTSQQGMRKNLPSGVSLLVLHSVKPRGRWMALKSHRSEKEEGQSTKAICCHLRTSAEQRGSEHQDHAGNPCGAVTFIHQTGQSRGHGSICQSPARLAGPRICAKHHSKRIFLKLCSRRCTTYHCLEMRVYVQYIAKSLMLQAYKSDR